MTTENKTSYCKRLKKEWLCEMDAKGGPIENETKLILNLQFYHDSMALQESSLHWYRALFITLEATMLALAYFLIQKPIVWVWIPSVPGILSCFAWMIVCTQRANLVDKQRREIEKLIQHSEALSTWYDIYRNIDKDLQRRIAQDIFNIGFPVLLIFVWIGLIIKFSLN